MYQKTTALQKIAKLQKRIRIIQGGTSAGKTIAILLYLIDLAQSTKVSISIVSESLPHLKRGAMRDFFNILKEHHYYFVESHNKTDNIYSFESGSFIEFFGADQPDKIRGPRRDVLFINEANNVPYITYDQLEVRTRLMTILDFNPVSEFWVHEDVIPNIEHDFVILTYRDNEALDEQIVKSIESRKQNANWWRVFGLGQIGVNEGQIYADWKPIKSPPSDARLIRRGLDFGYTLDPTALVAIYKWNNAYILDEEIYQKGMSNKDIADKIKTLPDVNTLIIADSAEPKSIDEMTGYGLKVSGSTKGQGSVNYGIQLVQDQIIFVTERSHNIKKEQMNYLWKIDRNGKPLNEPEGIFNHSMDAIRYGLVDVIGIPAQQYNKARIGL